MHFPITLRLLKYVRIEHGHRQVGLDDPRVFQSLCVVQRVNHGGWGLFHELLLLLGDGRPKEGATLEVGTPVIYGNLL